MDITNKKLNYIISGKSVYFVHLIGQEIRYCQGQPIEFFHNLFLIVSSLQKFDAQGKHF